MADLSTLHINKNLLENCSNDLSILKESFDEVSEARNFTDREVGSQLARILETVSASPVSPEAVSQIKTQMSAIMALLKETLKVKLSIWLGLHPQMLLPGKF